MLGKRLGALNASGDIPQDCKEFIEQVGNIFRSLPDLLFSLPLYRLYPTKEWKAVINAHTAVRKLATKFIEERMVEIGEDYKRMLEKNEEIPDKVDFLTYILHAPGKMTLNEVTGNVIDLLGAGVETVRLYNHMKHLSIIINNPLHTMHACRLLIPWVGHSTVFPLILQHKRN